MTNLFNRRKIKVAIFVDGDFIPSYDGASNRFHYLSRYLSLNGVDVVIFHGYRKWSNISLIKKEPFKTYIFPVDSYYNLELISSLLLKEQIDIIQFDNLEPILLQGMELSQLSGAKLVSEMHYVVKNLAKRLGANAHRLSEIENMEKLVSKSIDHIICLSKQDKLYFEKNLGLKQEKISVIPSGVDCREIKYWGPNFEAKNIIFLGNLFFEPNEDAVRVIKNQVYPRLRQDGFRFTIAGDCPDNLRSELSEADFVFTGIVPDLNSLFKEATLALAPIDEGTGMRIKFLNYFAAGTPIITTNVATNGFNDKKNFYIEDDYSIYPSIIVSLWENKNKLRELSRSGRVLVSKKYDWNIIARETKSVYNKLAKEVLVERADFEVKNYLKNKEPVWLQEAVNKGRFKEVTAGELPDNFSFSVINKNTIKSYKVEKIVALEGMPGSGKTTFIKNYLKTHSEAGFLPQLEIDNLRNLYRDDLKTSKNFLMFEKEKTDLIENMSQYYEEILLDRTFLTTLAYCYARSKLNDKAKGQYELLIKFFFEKIKHKVTFPTHVVCLDTTTEVSVQRRWAYEQNKEYKNWFSTDFLNFFREFYENEARKFVHTNNLYRIDTTNLSVEDVRRRIEETI